jgi:SAM-dependent MidA family methyltransferase
LTRWEDLPRRSIRGIIFSNELLDAFPFHRLGWNASRKIWFEWRVDRKDERFCWVRSEWIVPKPRQTDQPALWQRLPEELAAVLPDDFTIDVCPAAPQWWSEAAARLQAGKLLTFDYGVEEEELFEPRREHGTLRSYRGHRVTSDPLADPGQQDLTAHVDFSALKRAGTAAGLVEDFFGSQANFLTGIVQRISQEPVGFGEWTPAQTRQFQTLTHPQHLGRSFRMLIQAKRGSGSVSNG